jgi:hypothetical protein
MEIRKENRQTSFIKLPVGQVFALVDYANSICLKIGEVSADGGCFNTVDLENSEVFECESSDKVIPLDSYLTVKGVL